MKKFGLSILPALLLVVVQATPTIAGTVTVSSYSDFLAATTGQTTTTTNLNGVTPNNAPLVVNGATIYPYGSGGNGNGRSLTIQLANPVTAFGLNYGTLNSSTATFSVSNNFFSTNSMNEVAVPSPGNVTVVSISIDANGRLSNAIAPFRVLGLSQSAADTILPQRYFVYGPSPTTSGVTLTFASRV